jgi:hypothetical protein
MRRETPEREGPAPAWSTTALRANPAAGGSLLDRRYEAPLSSGDASDRLRCRCQRLGFRLQERVGYPVAESQEAGSGYC